MLELLNFQKFFSKISTASFFSFKVLYFFFSQVFIEFVFHQKSQKQYKSTHFGQMKYSNHLYRLLDGIIIHALNGLIGILRAFGASSAQVCHLRAH